jgi:hypothetical protein
MGWALSLEVQFFDSLTAHFLTVLLAFERHSQHENQTIQS